MFINDFLEKYSNIQNYKKDVLNPYPDSLNQTIFNKEEFHELRLPKIEEKPQGGTGELMKHQKIVSRYLSSHTLYDSLLLVHEPGTGKSCSSIGTVEKIRAENSSIKGALFLVKGPNLINNLINELLFVCTDGRYVPANFENLTDLERSHRINKKLKDFYQFRTFETFATELGKSSDTYIKEHFSNLVIVIDEVHNLRIQPGEDEEKLKQTYNQFHRFLHLIQNCKVILMSGTPMKDKPEEIASIMNLILPENKQLPTGNDFVEEYLDQIDNGTYVVKEDQISSLKKYLKGRVSYLRSVSDENIKKKFIGETIPPLKYFKVDVDRMSEFQSKVYADAFRKDKEDEGIYLNSRFASLFVYPDGSYGNKGFKEFIDERELEKKVFENEEMKTVKYNVYTLKNTLTKVLEGKTVEEKLEKLQKYSSKYHRVIKELLDAKDKSAFVYCEYVEGSGLILFSKLLELFGFSNAKGTEKTEKLRYAIITNKTTSPAGIKAILKTFNSPQNKNGNIIKVILGSKVIGEGFSLKNVQKIHILTPHWNYAETDQAIARGYRLFSHKDLGKKVIIDVYQHVSLNDKGATSIDLKMYKTSEDKDISIHQIERILKESAFDCALNYDRNLKTEDGTRECDYEDCTYKCDGIEEDEYKSDLLSYNLFYIQDKVDEIISSLQILFNKRFSYYFSELQRIFKKYNDFQTLSALSKSINEKIRFTNPYGFYSYLSESQNQYYLTNNMNYLSAFTDVFFDNYPILKKEGFRQEVDSLYYQSLPSLIDKMLKEKDDKKREEILRKIPLDIQEEILENSILANLQKSKKNVQFRDWLLNFYKEFIIDLDDLIISTLLNKSLERLRCLKKNTDEWYDCSSSEEEKFKKLSEKEKKDLESNKYGYYAIIEKATNTFAIRDVSLKDKITQADDRKKSRGRVCSTWQRQDILKIIDKIELKVPDKEWCKKDKDELVELINNKKYKNALKAFSEDKLEKMSKDKLCRILYFAAAKKEITCDLLENWFKDNKLVVYV